MRMVVEEGYRELLEFITGNLNVSLLLQWRTLKFIFLHCLFESCFGFH